MTYPPLHLLVDGAFRAGEGREVEPVFNPATGRPLADLPHATAGDLEDALEAAQRGFRLWRAVTAVERARVLKRGGHCAVVLGESRKFSGAATNALGALERSLQLVWGPTKRSPTRRRVSDRTPE